LFAGTSRFVLQGVFFVAFYPINWSSERFSWARSLAAFFSGSLFRCYFPSIPGRLDCEAPDSCHLDFFLFHSWESTSTAFFAPRRPLTTFRYGKVSEKSFFISRASPPAFRSSPHARVFYRPYPPSHENTPTVTSFFVMAFFCLGCLGWKRSPTVSPKTTPQGLLIHQTHCSVLTSGQVDFSEP